ncbi:MAG: hypothetical protein V3V08_08940 [Nannocystaceae bacterium]
MKPLLSVQRRHESTPDSIEVLGSHRADLNGDGLEELYISTVEDFEDGCPDGFCGTSYRPEKARYTVLAFALDARCRPVRFSETGPLATDKRPKLRVSKKGLHVSTHDGFWTRTLYGLNDAGLTVKRRRSETDTKTVADAANKLVGRYATDVLRFTQLRKRLKRLVGKGTVASLDQFEVTSTAEMKEGFVVGEACMASHCCEENFVYAIDPKDEKFHVGMISCMESKQQKQWHDKGGKPTPRWFTSEFQKRRTGMCCG